MYSTCHTQVVTEAKDYDDSLYIVLEGRLEYSVQVLLITSPLGPSNVLRFPSLLPDWKPQQALIPPHVNHQSPNMFCIQKATSSTRSYLTTNQDIIRGVIDRALTKKVDMVPGLRCVGVMTTGDFFAPDSIISRGGRRKRVIQAGSYRVRFGSFPHKVAQQIQWSRYRAFSVVAQLPSRSYVYIWPSSFPPLD